MKLKLFFVGLIALSLSSVVVAQDKKPSTQSIISRTAVLKKYYAKNELQEMPKGALIDLCIERIGALTKILPYVALATKPGITLTDFGIPNTSETKKMFTAQEDGTTLYLDVVTNYNRTVLPYADKDDLIKAVLFYEGIMKSLHDFNEM